MEKLTRTAYQTGPNLYATKLEAKNAIHYFRFRAFGAHQFASEQPPGFCRYEVAMTSAIAVNDGNLGGFAVGDLRRQPGSVRELG